MRTFKISIIILVAGILFAGCKEKKEGIEIVPNLESIYLSENDVDTIPKPEKGFEAKIENDLVDALKPLTVGKTKSPVLYKISLRIFLNETGKIDKIKDMGSYNGVVDSTDIKHNFISIDSLDAALASGMNDWQFSPAIKNGKPVKYWHDLKVNIEMKPNGTYNVSLPDFLNSVPDMNDFVKVDKMPELKTTSMPVYPERAKRSGLEGTVFVKTLVNQNGKPDKAVIIKSTDEIFNQSSIDAAMKFTFLPALKNNMPVAVWVVIPFKYKLSSTKSDVPPKSEHE